MRCINVLKSINLSIIIYHLVPISFSSPPHPIGGSQPPQPPSQPIPTWSCEPVQHPQQLYCRCPSGGCTRGQPHVLHKIKQILHTQPDQPMLGFSVMDSGFSVLD